MSQIINILTKDLRRYWRESAASLALLIIYAWNDTRGWAGEFASYSGIGRFIGYQVLSGLISVLLPIAWVFLITRAIQGESLVGDKQFWVTRPYEWKKLLIAKLLFLTLTINLPLFIVDLALLAVAGFHPFHYLAGLCWMQLMISLVIVLPTVALATVTASVVRMMLAILGITIYMILVAGLHSLIPSSSFGGPAESLQFDLLIGACIAVILWQYAKRKTSQSRWLTAALGLVVALIVVATPYDAIVRREFPLLSAGEQPPKQFALLPPEEEAGRWTHAASDNDDESQVYLPLATSNIPNDTILVVSGYKIWIDAPNSLHWSSGWESHGAKLFPDDTRTVLSVSMKNSFFERVKSAPVTARVSLLLSIYHDGKRRDFLTPEGEFQIPEAGFCSAETSYLRQLRCRVPLRGPSSLLITSDLKETTCPALGNESKAETQEIARDWTQSSESGPAEFGISPVKTLVMYLWARHVTTQQVKISGICPGTPLTISNPEFVRSARVELELNGLRLDEYRVPQLRGSTGYGLFVRHR